MSDRRPFVKINADGRFVVRFADHIERPLTSTETIAWILFRRAPKPPRQERREE